ncbi:hypothetical protein ACIPZF_18570 [Pseudomonas sp. NPDC089752]|uniref:hypothetical protein n=1 Tax=Pseudomonas sp. NPDC089752 TaxID=3364472 RepID=UPI00381DE817
MAGKVELEIAGSSTSQASAMAVQGERLLVLCKAYVDGKACTFVCALLADGALDRSFAQQGLLRVPFGGEASVVPIDLQVTSDDTFVVLAEDRSQFCSAPLLARYRADGSPDMSFGNAGVVSLRRGGAALSDEPCALLPCSDDSLMVAATRFDADGKASGLLVRLQPDGTLAQGFHQRGFFTFSLRDAVDVSFDGLMQQRDGQIVVWGMEGSSGLLLRLNKELHLDTGFAHEGVAHLMLPAIYRQQGVEIFDVAEDEVGCLLVAGATASAPHAGVLCRVADDGRPDPLFNGGMIRVNTAVVQGSRWLRVFHQEDGDIVVAGLAGVPFNGEATQLLVGRYLKNGGLDSRFGAGRGMWPTNVDRGADITTCALAWGDSRLVLGGISSAGPEGRCCLVCYKS